MKTIILISVLVLGLVCSKGNVDLFPVDMGVKQVVTTPYVGKGNGNYDISAPFEQVGATHYVEQVLGKGDFPQNVGAAHGDINVSTALPLITPPTNFVLTAAPLYTFCANEGQTCSTLNAPRIVAYGQGCENYFYRVSTGPSIACNNPTFGDPKSGFVKHCSKTTPMFTFYSLQGGQVCNPYPNSVLVAYGSSSNYNNYNYAPLSPYNCLPCTNAQFKNPTPGVQKRCYISRLPVHCP